MPGGNDPDCRRMMRFDNWNEHETSVYETVRILTELRTNSLPLLYGDFETLYLSDKQYAYCRSYFDQVVVVVMNKSGTEEKLTFDLPDRFSELYFKSHFGSAAGLMDGTFEVSLPGRSFDIFNGKTK
jgi:glycosidase